MRNFPHWLQDGPTYGKADRAIARVIEEATCCHSEQGVHAKKATVKCAARHSYMRDRAEHKRTSPVLKKAWTFSMVTGL